MCGRHNELRRGGRAAAMLQLRVHVPGTGGTAASARPLRPPPGTGTAPASAPSGDAGEPIPPGTARPGKGPAAGNKRRKEGEGEGSGAAEGGSGQRG